MERYNWTAIIRKNIFVLGLVGLWPKGTQKYGFNLYTTHALVTITLFGFTQSLFQTILLLTNLNDVEIVTGIAFLSISEMLVVLKMFYLARNVQIFKRLLITLDDDLFQPKNKEQVDLTSPSFKLWNLMYKMLWCSINVAIVFWSLVPFIDKSIKDHNLPFLSWYPYNAKTSPFFEISYVHQTLSICFITSVNVNLDTLIAAFMMYTGAQLDILSDNLRNLEGENFEEELVRCVNHHREIIKFTRSFNDAFNWTIFAQFFASAISIGFSMFLMSTTSPLNKEFYSILFYGTSAFLEILIYCWFGNEVQMKNTNVPIKMYECNWVEASRKNAKELLFFMMVAQRPLTVSALNLFELSLENFLKILKSAWSYFALVSQLIE
ncbi:odorant receptor 13a-like [Zophobas morio]|uniref:odorant receptor 13a-like n=1 Tax=Zophobas morio TaxID=2755281 RepID=UPI00308382BA